MRVAYLAQLFELANEPGSDRQFFNCEQLVKAGHEVTVITSNVEYKTATAKYENQGLWPIKKTVDGIAIWYVYAYRHFRGSFKKRFWYYLTYLFTALWASINLKRPDVIYAVSTPLTVGFLGYCLSRLKRAPFVFEVTDIWPDAAVATGVVSNQALIRAAQWLEMFCYRKAARIVVLGQVARAHILQKGVPADKVTVITNGVDESLFQQPAAGEADSAEMRRKLGFDGHLVCMYLGAHGAYNALWTIIEAAEALRDDPQYLFVLVGDGDEKAHLQRMVQERNLGNVRFLPPVPRAQTPALLRAADLFLLPNRRGEFYTMNLPNKLFDFLASGRPIVVAGYGETANLIQQAGAGRVVPAEDGAAMTQAVVELANLSDKERSAMGAAGRQYVLKHYNRHDLSRVLLDLLQRVVETS